MTRSCGLLLGGLGLVAAMAGCDAGPPGPGLLLRAEQLTVTPSTGPVTHVQAYNGTGRTFRGTLALTPPDGWKLNASEQPVTIPPGETARVAFAIERGVDSAENRYPVTIVAAGGEQRVERRQEIVCASAPYYKPTIDGAVEDWADAIPVTFASGGKRTTVSTYWSRRSFSLLVAVEEDALRRMPTSWNGEAIDAVQVSFSPRGAVTPPLWAGKASRYELLLAATKDGGRCVWLVRPGEQSQTGFRAFTDPEDVAGARIAVVRADGVTYYECAIPLKALPLLRPDPGREFCFSLLVHDPGGTGLRDWGEAAGLWAHQRTDNAWTRWRGGQWPLRPPFDNKIEWGFCSSKH